MSKEAIAIKALEALARLGNGDQYGNSTGNVIARTALFEMAEQPAQQEPWAWLFQHEETGLTQWLEAVWAEEDDPIGDLQGRLIAEQAAQAQQEPVGEVNRYGLDSHGRKWHGIHWYDPNVDVPHGTKLYTTPQAQRKPLTDEQIDELARTMVKGSKSVNWLCRAIEAKLKEKNT